MNVFTPYAVGICSASVCTSLPIDEAVARMNEECPTGIESKWALSNDTHFRGGAENGCPCTDSPETHRHWLLNC